MRAVMEAALKKLLLRTFVSGLRPFTGVDSTGIPQTARADVTAEFDNLNARYRMLRPQCRRFLKFVT